MDCEESWARKNWCFWTVVLEKTLESPLTAKRSNQSIIKEISPGCSLEGLMLKLNSNTLATSCDELTHWKRPWCWEGLGAGEGNDRGWDGWMSSPTQWTWVWVNSGRWWWTGRPGVLRFMGRKELDTTEQLNWTELMLSEISQRKTNTVCYHLYVESKKWNKCMEQNGNRFTDWEQALKWPHFFYSAN